MASKYKEFKGLHLPTIEQEVLTAWEQDQAFEKSIALREGASLLYFTKAHPVPTACPVFTTLFHAP